MKKNPLFLTSILMVLALTGCQSSPGGSSLSSSEQGSSSSSDSSSSSGSSSNTSSGSTSSSNNSSSSSSSENSSLSIGGDYTSTPTLFFHYHRSDKTYDGWGIWIWLDGADGVRYEFSSTDDYGVYGSYLLSTWGSASKINYIVYKMNGSSWVKDPGQDESLSFASYKVDDYGNVACFKISGQTGLYTTYQEAVQNSSSSSGSSSISSNSSSGGSYSSNSENSEWYNTWNIDESGETRNTLPTTPSTAKDYTDFKLWTEYPSSYWKTINKYSGERTDFRNEQIYFTITSRFYNGDLTNDAKCWDQNSSTAVSDPPWRGDFKGLIEKMDYIKALGFTAIWITPVVENASGLDYHGYHASNFDKVDPRYLSEDIDFQTVINEAHSRDMKIVLDVVWNHCGNFGENGLMPLFYKKGDLSYNSVMKVRSDSGLPSNYSSLSGGDQYAARLAMMKNSDGVNHDSSYYFHHYGNFSWETYGEQLAQIAGDCVDLNTENPVVAEYLLRCYGTFIRMGVDGFRIDTMKQISRLTLNKFFFPAFNLFAEKCGNPNFYMFGEVCARVRGAWNHDQPAVSAPFYTWKETKSFSWGTSVEDNINSTIQAFSSYGDISSQPTSNNTFLNSSLTYHTPDHSQSSGSGVIDFPMHWNFSSASDSFNNAVSIDKYFNDSTYNVVYVNSHDYSPDGRDGYVPEYSTSKWAEDFNLMYTFRGIPCVYYGTEVQFQAGKVIDNGGNTPLSDTGRAYFGNYLEGSITTTGFGSYSSSSGNMKTTLKSTLSQHLMKLSKIRQAVPALRLGQYDTSHATGNMAFIRRYTSGSIDSLACVAISSGASFSSLPSGTYVNLVNGDRKVVTNGNLVTSTLSEGQMAVYVLENASSGTLSGVGDVTQYLQ